MLASHLLSFVFFFLFCFSFSAETACPSTRFTPRIARSKEDAQLKVLVPNITSESFRQLVNCSDPSNVRGFCIDVFETALSLLPGNLSSSTLSYTCFNFSPVSNSTNNTFTYNDMIDAVANGSYDAVVGDVTISAQRAYKVDFTQQYINSGVVIISKTRSDDTSSEWLLFGLPFTWRMWLLFVGAFTSIGFVLWLVERERHPELIDASFRKRISKVFWLIIEALVLLERESIKSTAGRFAMVAWVFVILLLASSYTAGLSSFLTAGNLSPATIDILALRDSNKTIAYRKGSITQDFLTARYHIPKGQLESIRANFDFIDNITKGPSAGGVIAIIDELPYASIMLANLSCDYGISGPQLTSEGFGFGFRHGLQLWVKEVSIALLNLTESGCLQEMQEDQKLSVASKCSSDRSHPHVSWKSILPLSGALCTIIISCVSILYISKKQTRRTTNAAHTSIDSSIKTSRTFVLEMSSHS